VRSRTAEALLSAAAVRSTAQRMLQLALTGDLAEWVVDLDRLPATAQRVSRVMRERYPDLVPPLHARWRHFVFGGRDLWSEIRRARPWDSAAAGARAAFDLAITSVLLDAGAGPDWRYQDAPTGLTVARSEGLALASLRWFAAGGLSEDPRAALRADAGALRRVSEESVRQAFQVREGNPLAGAAGRAALLNRLGEAVQARPDLFAREDRPRPGGLFDVLAQRSRAAPLSAADILEVLLTALGPIWPDRPQLAGVCLGDCWPHPALQGEEPEAHFVPLHKLSQWLTYSLIEPLGEAGVPVGDLDALTGLAEYRNGGLFVDTGVLLPRDEGQLSQTHSVDSPFVVGWRALTVALLDELRPHVAASLELPLGALPLARMLEGGTWAAGRAIAREKRTGGGPPFAIVSDGTVF
jgi:hypothetical protein